MPETMGSIGSTQGVNASAMPSRKKRGSVQTSERSPSHCVICWSLPEAPFQTLALLGSPGVADVPAGAMPAVADATLSTWIVRVCGG